MITYMPEAEDYIAAAKLEIRLQYRSQRRAWFLVLALFGGLVLVSVLGSRDKGSVQVIPLIVMFILVAGLLAYRYYVHVPQSIRTGLAKRAPKPVRIEWDEERFVSEDEVIKATAPWPEFTRWLEAEEVFILFFRGRRFQVIPKRAFPDSAAARLFHDVLLRKIGPAGAIRKEA